MKLIWNDKTRTGSFIDINVGDLALFLLVLNLFDMRMNPHLTTEAKVELFLEDTCPAEQRGQLRAQISAMIASIHDILLRDIGAEELADEFFEGGG